ncbi:MAG: O-antigen ligase [Pseudomonadota bacterium]
MQRAWTRDWRAICHTSPMTTLTAHRLPDDSYRPVRWIIAAIEIACAALLLFMFYEGPLARMFSDGQTSDGNAFLRLIWLPAYGLVFLLCLTRLPRMLIAGFRLPILVAMLLLTAASVFWSIDVALTARRVVAIGFTSLFGVYLASRYSWRDLLRLLAVMVIALAIISFGVSLAMPEFGRDFETHGGAWRGMWWEKNTLGAHMSRGTFLCGFLAIVDVRYRRYWVFGTMLCLALVVLSASKTSLLGTMLGFGILAAAAWMKRGPLETISFTWVGVTIGGAIALALLVDPVSFLKLLGRDATLTGRTDIWVELTYSIRQRIWLGYGYGSFWSEGSMAAFLVRESLQWEAPTAHNGWLDLWLSIGLAGVVLFLFNFVQTVWRAIRRAFAGWSGVFAVGYLAQFFLFTISESIVLQQNAITWVVYMAVATRLVLDAHETRIAARRQAREQYVLQIRDRPRRLAASRMVTRSAPDSRA